jgi:phage tail tape-measure protein
MLIGFFVLRTSVRLLSGFSGSQNQLDRAVNALFSALSCARPVLRKILLRSSARACITRRYAAVTALLTACSRSVISLFWPFAGAGGNRHEMARLGAIRQNSLMRALFSRCSQRGHGITSLHGVAQRIVRKPRWPTKGGSRRESPRVPADGQEHCYDDRVAGHLCRSRH